MPLTVLQIRNAKPAAKPFKLADGQGMYLEIAPSGGRVWRLKYRFEGKENRHTLGAYPAISLADARELRDKAKKLLTQGMDPNRARKHAKLNLALSHSNTFESVSRNWVETGASGWTSGYASKVLRRLELYVFPWIGRLPITDVKAHGLLAALRKIEAKGAIETAHRTLNICDGVFRFAIASELTEHNPAAKLRGVLKTAQERHHAALVKPDDVAGLLRAIDGYQGADVTRYALRLAPLVFVRPGELRQAQWPEFDLDRSEWRIPAARMKMRVEHLVPLSKQAVHLLRELHHLTGHRKFIFPGIRDPKRPMSENTVNAALRRLGYSHDEMTGHGFRSTASTMLNEHGWNKDAIERQLAHNERDAVRAAYNKANHLKDRRQMMQKWADYLDELRLNVPNASATLDPLTAG